MRKKIPIRIYLFTLSLLFTCTIPAWSQDETEKTKAIIFHSDSLFWNAYNTCDIEKFTVFFSDDIEFYHDKGGVTNGNAAFAESFKKNLCNNPDFRLRREVVDGTVKVYPLAKDNKIYGAIISGEHVFYVTEKGKSEYLDGRANFTHLWMLKEGAWKMTRVLSYNHHPANEDKTVIEISDDKLEQWTGTYKASDGAMITVQRQEHVLMLNVGDKGFTLYPLSENIFFVKERNLVFEFTKDTNNQPLKLIVKENGNIVEQAPFQGR